MKNLELDMSTWSDSLKKKTKDALLECSGAPDGFIHMKNINGSFGRISLEDLVRGKLLIHDKKTKAEYFYKAIEELVAAGWAID
jgi:hypothetical protein